jgi:hypothetical protein
MIDLLLVAAAVALFCGAWPFALAMVSAWLLVVIGYALAVAENKNN